MVHLHSVCGTRDGRPGSYVFFLPLYLEPGIWEWNPLYLSEGWGLSIFTSDGFRIGIAVALVSAPGVISGPIFGALSDKVGRRSVIAFLMIVSVVLSVTTVLGGGGLWDVGVDSLMFGLFHSSVNSLTQAAAIDEVEGKGSGCYVHGSDVGQQCSFRRIGGSSSRRYLVVRLRTWDMAFYAAAALFMVGFLVSLIMPRGGSKQTQPSH